MQKEKLFLLAVLAFLGGCRRPAPLETDRLTPLQFGGVCIVDIIVGDLGAPQPCTRVRELLPPMGTCAVRQVLAASTEEAFRLYLIGDRTLEDTNESIWARYRQRETRPLRGTVARSMETRKRTYCSSATSWSDIQKDGAPITFADIDPRSDLPFAQRNLELLYISSTEPNSKRVPTSLYIYLK